ncbi:hypothetical protein [Kibdelosporangium persicum]|uniref:hypothetical protein n=1 Tax=Kibdelosporangium persicum TaxID=2698649 RepID=UPI0015672902|nr:hypothetical protein [Kibdelosporangium persicum]
MTYDWKLSVPAASSSWLISRVVRRGVVVDDVGCRDVGGTATHGDDGPRRISSSPMSPDRCGGDPPPSQVVGGHRSPSRPGTALLIIIFPFPARAASNVARLVRVLAR